MGGASRTTGLKPESVPCLLWFDGMLSRRGMNNPRRKHIFNIILNRTELLYSLQSFENILDEFLEKAPQLFKTNPVNIQLNS